MMLHIPLVESSDPNGNYVARVFASSTDLFWRQDVSLELFQNGRTQKPEAVSALQLTHGPRGYR
jgi:hypothetical protein